MHALMLQFLLQVASEEAGMELNYKHRKLQGKGTRYAASLQIILR